MHILKIPSFFPPMGGRFCLEQARALQAEGNTVRILACVQLGASVAGGLFFTARQGRLWEETDGVEVYRSYMRAVPRCIRHNQRRWCRIVEEMYDDYKRRCGRPDILHAHCCQWAGVAARTIAAREGIPYVVTEHNPSGIWEASYGKGWTRAEWARRLLRDTYEHAGRVIPVSQELVDDIAPFFGRSYASTPVSNIIDTDFFACRPRERKEGHPFRFCCLAVGDVYRKGFDVLAEAMKGQADTELHIAGRGTDSEEMRRLFAGSGQVIFHGELDKRGVRDLLYSSDALVLASRSEAQPLVIMEAVCTGIPAVTTYLPAGLPREAPFLLAEKGDVASLRRRMEEARRAEPDPEACEKLRDFVSPRTVARQIMKVYEEVIT